jgi:hypothetical protein
MTIVRYAHRYKRPPRKRKPNPAALAMPAIITIDRKRAAIVVATLVLGFSQVSGCASIAAYEASHPYYRFPGGGGGGGGTGG